MAKDFDFFEEMRRIQNEMNRLFDSFWSRPKRERFLSNVKRSFEFAREPSSDLRETDNEVIAYIEMPGVEKKDIQLKVTENDIEIKAEKKAESRIEKKGYSRAERSYRGFYKAASLPVKVIPEKVKATYKNGVLEIIMPKKEKKKLEKKSKRVEIE